MQGQRPEWTSTHWVTFVTHSHINMLTNDTSFNIACYTMDLKHKARGTHILAAQTFTQFNQQELYEAYTLVPRINTHLTFVNLKKQFSKAY